MQGAFVGLVHAQEAERDIHVLFTHIPPFSYVGDEGPTGLTVEILQAIADREGLNLTLEQAVNPAEALESLRLGQADLVSQLAPTPQRERTFVFSEQVASGAVSVIVDPTRHDIVRLDQTQGFTLGYVTGSVAEPFATRGPFTAIEVETTDALVGKFLSGEVDGVIFIDVAFNRISWIGGFHDRVRVLNPSLLDLSLNSVLLPDAPNTAFMLAAIEGFSQTDDFARLQEEWLGDLPYWTAERIRLAVIAGILSGIILVILGFGLRRQALARVDAAQARLLQDVTRNLPFTVALADGAGVIQFFNRADGDRTDYGADDALLGPGAISVPPERPVDPQGALSAGAMDSIDHDNAVELEQDGGRIIKRLITSLSDGSHLIVREDVTEDHRIRDELDKQQSRLSAVMDAAQGGIVGLDLQGRIVIANLGARHLLGGVDQATPFAWPETVTFLDSEVLHPLEASANPVNRALNGQALNNEIAIMSRAAINENPRYVRLTSAEMPVESSPDVAVVMMITDVTEQERNRQQLERAGRLDALGQLTGGIAHDFNNLLATILYGVQLAQGADDPGKRAMYFQTAQDAVRRGSDLTQRLLAFAKRQPSVETSANMYEVIGALTKIAKAAVQERIELKVDPIDPSLWVFCDIGQLENAILNILLNARDAIEDGARGDKITIAVREVTDAMLRGADASQFGDVIVGDENDISSDEVYVEVSVTDNGPGMSDEVKRRAIDPFFTTKDARFGSGLGLSIVYGFVQQSRGFMRIYSIEGEGTTVRLILPQGEPEYASEPPPEPRELPRGNGETVLIVEDELGLLAMMRDLVEGLGYLTQSATSGQAALDVLDADPSISVVMTDIVMPGGIGGFRLAQLARERRADIPVIYMSGYTGFSEAEMGDAPAPMLQKPSSPEDVADALHAVLSTR